VIAGFFIANIARDALQYCLCIFRAHPQKFANVLQHPPYHGGIAGGIRNLSGGILHVKREGAGCAKTKGKTV
jgi:hypothetical protein